MTPEQFKDWRKSIGFRSREMAAQDLGISASTIALYEAGVRRDDPRPVAIPLTIELACMALEIALTNELRKVILPVFAFMTPGIYPLSFDSSAVEGEIPVLFGNIITPRYSEKLFREDVEGERGYWTLRTAGMAHPQNLVAAMEFARAGKFQMAWNGPGRTIEEQAAWERSVGWR